MASEFESTFDFSLRIGTPPRAVGEFVRNHVPDSIPVYMFQSTMSDFNYYAGRATIPVISSEEEIAKLSTSHAQAYLLINDKDLKEVKRLKDNREVVIEAAGRGPKMVPGPAASSRILE